MQNENQPDETPTTPKRDLPSATGETPALDATPTKTIEIHDITSRPGTPTNIAIIGGRHIAETDD